MMASNHMLAGAVVATGVQQPLLIVPLAFASHFLLDMLPHFGVHEQDHSKRNKHPLFRYILVIDIALVVSLLAILPFVLKGAISGWALLLGMVLAWIPDAVWVHHFIHRHKGRIIPHGWLSKFHEKIQWFERPPGIIIELVWFFGMGITLGFLAG
ncbi:MAG: hypothetical protein ABWX94_00965 [Candidatus Saccharimonadales bacterium]